MTNAMRIVDLSQMIAPDMPLWPGTPAPLFDDLGTVSRDGFGERWLQLSSHTGTHVDAPAHIIDGAATLDQLDAERFIGSGVLLDLRAVRPGDAVGADCLLAARASIEASDFLLLHTGWSRLWGKDAYHRGYPVLSVEAAALLAGSGLKGVGIDAPSFDSEESAELPVHRCLLGAGLVLIENLTALDKIGGNGFYFSALPLPIAGAEASPVRAIATIPDFVTK